LDYTSFISNHNQQGVINSYKWGGFGVNGFGGSLTARGTGGAASGVCTTSNFICTNTSNIGVINGPSPCTRY
jgi:hypothetical protein